MSQPDFLGIGVQKGGTTWLHRALQQHPEVWTPFVKELHYFSNINYRKMQLKYEKKFRRRSETVIQKAQSRPRSNPLTVEMAEALIAEPMFSEEWYKKQFEVGRRFAPVVGEITPGYWLMDKHAFLHLRQQLTTTKFILNVRDPVARAMSAVRMYASADVEYRADEKFTGDTRMQRSILNHSSYSKFLPRWVDAFGDGRLMALPFQRIIREPEETMREVERFLGLKEAPYEGLQEARNQSPSATIHPDTLPFLETHLASERDYLRQTFGEAFVADI